MPVGAEAEADAADTAATPMAIAAAASGRKAQGSLSISLAAPAASEPVSVCRHAALTALIRETPTARALPVLEALALGGSHSTWIDYQPALRLRVDVGEA